MEKRRLRPELRLFFIKKCIDELYSNRPRMQLWQRPESNRIKSLSCLEKVPATHDYLKFIPLNDQLFFFNGREPIYFYEQSKSLIFKVDLLINSKYFIETSFPSSIYLAEHRDSPREIVQGNEYFINFQLPGTQKSFKKPLLDFGINGCAFRISQSESPLFTPGDLLKVEKENYGHLISDRMAKICYIDKFYDNSYLMSQFYRVGLQFLV